MRTEVLTGDVPLGLWLSFGEKQGALLNQAIRSAADKYGPGFLLNSAAAMSNGARGAFQAGFRVDAASKYLSPAFPNPWNDWQPVKSGNPAWDRWVEEHTVHGAPVFR